MYFYERLSPRISSFLYLARWLAAELVLLGHVRALALVKWSDIPVSQRNPGLWLLFGLGSLGHQAVVVFFVLSGFLVGGSVVADVRQNRFSPKRYLVNRISRLYVVLLPALVLGWMLDWIGIHRFAGTGIYTHRSPYNILALYYDVSARMSPLVALGNAANLQTIVTPTLGSNAPLWSLANEFWYYLFFPALILPFVSRRASERVAWVALAVAVAWLTYPSILVYAVIWMLGVAVRLVPPMPAPPPWVMAPAVFVVGAACLRAAESGPAWLPFLSDLLFALTFLIFLLGAMYQRRSDSLPGSDVHKRLAGFSYSLYVLHFPCILLVLTWAKSAWGIGLSQQPAQVSLFMMALVFILANGYAWLVSRVTERHTKSVRRFLLALLVANGTKPSTNNV